MFKILLILIFIRPFISSSIEWLPNSIYSAILLGFLITWVIFKRFSLEEIKTIKFPLILFILALLLSSSLAHDKINSLKELYKYLIAILLFLVTTSLSCKAKESLIRGIVLSGLLVSLLAIYQYFFGFQHLADYVAKENISNPFILDYVKQKRAFSPFATPNILGGYLAMIIPLSLLQKNRTSLIIPLFLALLLTRSVGGLLSLFFGLVIYFYLQGKLKKKTILFLSGLILVILLILITRSATPKQHLQPVFSTVMRLNYWKDTLRIIKAHPLIGIGLGNFNLAESRFAHNSYLQIWAEMGILGIISIVWLIIAAFKSSLKNTTHKDQNTAIMTAGAIFLIHNFVDFSFFLPEVALIWWIILGLTIPKGKE
jgi:O-antigen ligase